MSLDNLPLATVLDETATLYETVAALPAVFERLITARPTGKPGSQPPPGAADLLDADEWGSAITAVDDWALFLAHVLLDELDGLGAIPHSTPGRLRLASRWTDHLEHHPDAHLRYAIGLDAREHLATLRRLSKRGTRTVRTNSPCLDVACTGEYVATIAGPDLADGDLTCSRCGSTVPREQWERWGSRTEWVTPARAASMLGIPVSTVRVWAHRYRWARQGTGRDVRYRTSDVRDTAGARGVPPVASLQTCGVS
ncbi:helix-turn-helix domain-containing protein [Ornithinimicrobium sufpigmenti]|uniref:helix-turn-helix domain-containing protein n=1 Tax=Ornithinimicrobium sufpigmenti TaxID=2508882 RepID=UPI001035714A|nr:MULTISPECIES: helix-turn-helix domain-containing protein [unclassified Ornithinimicrobium]